MIEMAYSTSTSDVSSDRYGWAALDRMVLWAVAQRSGSFDDPIRLVPAGIHYRLVRGSLRVLADAGLVARHQIRGVYEATAAGVALVQPRCKDRAGVSVANEVAALVGRDCDTTAGLSLPHLNEQRS